MLSYASTIKAGLALSMALALTACAGGSSPEPAQQLDLGTPVAGQIKQDALSGITLTYANSGGILQESQSTAIWNPFMEQSGAEVLQDSSDMGKLKATVESDSVTWDLFMEGNLETAKHCGTLFEELDYNLIDTSKLPEGTPTDKCMVPNILYGYVIAYNAEVFKDNPPTSAADFFDTEKFPGKRTVGQGETMDLSSMMELAYMADGKNPADITPEEIPNGLDKYRALGDNLISWQTGAQAQQQLESGEAVMGFVWSGRGYGAAAAGAPIVPMWDEWIVLVDSLAIPKGSKNVQAAHAAMNYFLGAEQQAKVTELSSYSPVNVDAKPQLDETAQLWLAADHLDTGFNSSSEFWVENYEAAKSAWIDWTTGN